MRKQIGIDRLKKSWFNAEDISILAGLSYDGEQWAFVNCLVDDPIGDIFLISNNGRVFNCYNQRLCELYPDDSTGYIKVSLPLCPSGYQNYNVHSLTAKAFVTNPAPDKKGQIHHINGDRHDNRAINLLWVTPGEHGALHVLKRADVVQYGELVTEMRQEQPIDPKGPLVMPEWRTDFE